MGVALVAITCYDPTSHAASNGWAGFGAMETLFRSKKKSARVGYSVMSIIQEHVRPGAMREILGENLHTSIAALVMTPLPSPPPPSHPLAPPAACPGPRWQRPLSATPTLAGRRAVYGLDVLLRWQ
jgi:hypothetical protein